MTIQATRGIADKWLMAMAIDSSRSQALRAAPFALAAALAWISVPVGAAIDWGVYGAATVLLLLSGLLLLSRSERAMRAGSGSAGATMTTASTRFGRLRGAGSSLLFLGAVALLRASAGGISSSVGVVSLIPVFYIALYGEGRLQLYAILAGVTVFYLAPIVVVGAPEYPSSQYRAALLTLVVSAIIGLATRRLVGDVRRQAQAAHDRERMLEQVSEVVRGLSFSSNARVDVCEAARRIGEASVAALFEPERAGRGPLRATATIGLDLGPVEISDERSAIVQAFASAQPRLVVKDIESHLGNREMWRQAGEPASVLYEPLLRGGEPVGVLAVGWPAHISANGARATVVALLAHEAAAVIDRADTLSELADMASTDPLTGLPNRRAWDALLAEALGAERPFVIAMLDFDRFKEFNDTHGHPAGDRLLKETSALWRDQLRAGDMLARLGGEEFGLLLLDCDVSRAGEAIHRLRGLMPYGQTCSVGFALRRFGESAEALTARADTALYEAKESGRDRVCTSA